MKVLAGLAGGLAGTLTVASLHEAMRKITSDAPRMDVLNKELIRKTLHKMNMDVPGSNELQNLAVGGEIVFDTAYYGLTGAGGKKGVWGRGLLLGLVAGITAVVLPRPLGLSEEPTSKTLSTRLMTIGLYVLGGLAAAAITKVVDDAQSNNEEEDQD